ncbi:MAG TPA: histidine kinase dimerization/phospho-acceptor domain-containing protein [Chthoniobacterales bacterium]|nr:histidine kinase dimerization/phospho-acceptor domain-containing protein [Chthoniobacterales bacterium]
MIDVEITSHEFQFGRHKAKLILAKDITEQLRAEAQICQLNEELEERVAKRTSELTAANQELEAFSYSVSHDLRAPLRAIIGYSHLILEDYAGRLDAEGERLLGVITREALRMSQLIDDLLSFSRVGRRRVELTEVDMTALALSAFQGLITAHLTKPPQLKIKTLPRHGEIRPCCVRSSLISWTTRSNSVAVGKMPRLRSGEHVIKPTMFIM